MSQFGDTPPVSPSRHIVIPAVPILVPVVIQRPGPTEVPRALPDISGAEVSLSVSAGLRSVPPPPLSSSTAGRESRGHPIARRRRPIKHASRSRSSGALMRTSTPRLMPCVQSPDAARVIVMMIVPGFPPPYCGGLLTYLRSYDESYKIGAVALRRSHIFHKYCYSLFPLALLYLGADTI